MATSEEATPEEAAEAQPEAQLGAVPALATEQGALRAALRAVMRLMLHGNSRPVHRPVLAAIAKLPPAWLAVAGADMSTMVRQLLRVACTFLDPTYSPSLLAADHIGPR